MHLNATTSGEVAQMRLPAVSRGLGREAWAAPLVLGVGPGLKALRTTEGLM